MQVIRSALLIIRLAIAVPIFMVALLILLLALAIGGGTMASAFLKALKNVQADLLACK